jgi:hypothetical protein
MELRWAARWGLPHELCAQIEQEWRVIFTPSPKLTGFCNPAIFA